MPLISSASRWRARPHRSVAGAITLHPRGGDRRGRRALARPLTCTRAVPVPWPLRLLCHSALVVEVLDDCHRWPVSERGVTAHAIVVSPGGSRWVCVPWAGSSWRRTSGSVSGSRRAGVAGRLERKPRRLPDVRLEGRFKLRHRLRQLLIHGFPHIIIPESAASRYWL